MYSGESFDKRKAPCVAVVNAHRWRESLRGLPPKRDFLRDTRQVVPGIRLSHKSKQCLDPGFVGKSRYHPLDAGSSLSCRRRNT